MHGFTNQPCTNTNRKIVVSIFKITIRSRARTGRLVQNEACVVKPLVNGAFMEHSEKCRFKNNAFSSVRTAYV